MSLLPKNNYAIKRFLNPQIQNEEEAYWLGFLGADGSLSNVNLIVLEISDKDRDHLEKYLKFLGVDSSCIQTRTRFQKKYNNFKTYCRFSFANPKIRENLNLVGIVKQKSLNFSFPSQNYLPEHLIPHFIRGYFDGDGYVSKGKPANIEIAGNMLFLSELIAYFKKYKINSFLKQNKNPVFGAVKIQGWKHVRLFYKHCYKNCSIFMERKYNRFQNFFKEFDSLEEKYSYLEDVNNFNSESRISEFPGVFWDKKRKVFRAFRGKRFVGQANTKEEARDILDYFLKTGLCKNAIKEKRDATKTQELNQIIDALKNGCKRANLALVNATGLSVYKIRHLKKFINEDYSIIKQG